MNYEKETTSVPTYVSLCSGYDGIGIGLKRAIPNLRTIAHVEIETYAIANLIAKMEAGLLDACPVFTDLKQFPYRELRDKVTILSAGFPCQPFSSAGKRQATEDPRHLWPWIADGVTAMRPRYVWFENVEGIISAKTADRESILKYVLGDLEERGYRCTWGVFSASETGAPHQRKRVFILGELSDTKCEGRSELPIKRKLSSIQKSFSLSEEGRVIKELGNTSSFGSCRGCEDSDRIKSEMLGSGLGKTRWPSRPGQQQYEWEEPRVVANSKGTRQSEAKTVDERQESESDNGDSLRNILKSDSRRDGQVNCEAQSCVGLSANGTAFRVDELRLLGNGVVPDTCELAFKTLIQQL
jgi:DNA (cytosine-5)-methyltransferase 1